MTIAELPQSIHGQFDPVEFEPLPGYIAEIIPKSDERVMAALQMESDVMSMLGDPGVKKDIQETYDDSGFIVLRSEGSDSVLTGAIRYMLPKQAQNKTFIDVAHDTGRPVDEIERLFLDQSSTVGKHAVRACTNLGEIIDASALSPELSNPAMIERYSDALLAACRMVGTVLLEEGVSTHVTGNLHGIFIGHAKRIGYPFQQLKDEAGELITSFRGNKTDFLPVFTSLELYQTLMNSAKPNTHLSKVRKAYENLTMPDKKTIAAAMVAATSR
jgi:hypothetical protein